MTDSPCANPMTPMVMTPMSWLQRVLGKVTSWGRFSSAVCLLVAIIREFQGADVAHVALWLAGVGGTFGITKWLTPDGGRQ